MALPTGTTNYLDITIDHTLVNETRSQFLYQVDLSSLIASIDAIINTESNIAVCNTNGSTVYPKHAVYTAGSKLLLYWSGPTSSAADKVFRVCFGASLNVLNSSSTFSNPGYTNRWSFDRVSGTTVTDDVGSNNGTIVGTDIVSGKFGNGLSGNASGDRLELGNVPVLSNATALSYEVVFKLTSLSSVSSLFICYINVATGLYAQIATPTAFNISFGNNYIAAFNPTTYITPDTYYHLGIIWNASGATNSDKVKAYLNGVSLELTYRGTAPANTGDLSSTPTYVGYTNDYSLYGTVDELGLCNSVVSGECFADRYNSLFNAEFFSAGEITEYTPEETTTLIKFTHYNPLKHNQYKKNHEKLIRSLRAYGMNI